MLIYLQKVINKRDYSMNIKKISLSSLLIFGFFVGFFSTNVAAACPPWQKPQNSCKETKTVSKFSGSASSYLQTFNDDIKNAGTQVTSQMKENSENEIKMMSESAAAVMNAITASTQAEIKQHYDQKKAFLDMKMNFMSEIQEREIRAKKAPVALDDTPEEVLFILNEINKGKISIEGEEGDPTGNVAHASEIIRVMKSTYDNNEDFSIPVKLKAGQSKLAMGEVCEDYDPNVPGIPTCHSPHKASPGAKLEIYFRECSRVKRERLLVSNAERSKSAINSTMKQKTIENSGFVTEGVLSTTLGSKISAKIASQKAISCSPSDLNNNFCGDLDDKTYIERVTENKIIPNGNLSAANFLTPSDVGSIDGLPMELSDEERAAVKLKSVSLNDTAPSENTPPLIYTYKTSSQYKASLDYIDNLINYDLVANQAFTERSNGANAEFQARFMSRQAALSLASSSLSEPLKNRIGKTLSEHINSGKELAENEYIKEDINGAGTLDIMAYNIAKDYEKITADSTGNESNFNMSSNEFESWKRDALVRQNDLTLKQLLQGERMELLIASILGNMVNSKENIDYMNRLKDE
jgi:hypothetical protein